ncbi:metal dependent phosphohydrolase [Alkaliphilus metalliredigens QYMF]|uniref:Metal dependent phosphohydrolase n=1 Tax=Alkaliphilus metalliredigens (strain QYMF) TaxID=293826 RepID=A6TNW3_ALKMQ|nr:HD-GYP domain-containing protein [Alkaliphilus metalliredigens]ABR47881.1 metal dependent phosphohydrolase [Alkaliphilus metalliredigens QYMF]
MRLVPINCIKEGSYLAQTIYDKEGRVLLQEGVILNDSLLQKVKDNAIYMIYVNDEYSQNEIEDIIKPQLRIAATKSIRDTFGAFEKHKNDESMKKNPAQIKRTALQEKEAVNQLNNISKSMVDEILFNKNLLINMVDIKCLDSYTYQHSVNVAVLSLVLGIELGLNRKELYDLCIGAMLHDIGRVMTPSNILAKEGKLTDAEYAIVKEHAVKGYEYLKENYDLSVPARMIALQHHERVDGTGYPQGLKDEQIHKLSKIVGIANVYDALTSDRPYRRAFPPNEAIELIMGGAGRFFDFEMAKIFVRKVNPYPEGTLVKLSNGEYGVVQEVYPNYPLRPKVQIIKQNATHIEIIIVDLLKECNVVIEKIQYEAPDNSVQTYLKNKN